MGFDQDRLLRLLLAHRAMLIGYIYAIVRDGHLAEDIFQNVSILVLRKGGDVADEAGFAPWARKVARFEALNAARKARRSSALDESILDALEPHWESADASEPSREVDALRRCVDKLSPGARQIVDMRYRDNLSGDRLARALAKPLNTIYVALARAHKALGECVRMRLREQGAAGP